MLSQQKGRQIVIFPAPTYKILWIFFLLAPQRGPSPSNLRLIQPNYPALITGGAALPPKLSAFSFTTGDSDQSLKCINHNAGYRSMRFVSTKNLQKPLLRKLSFWRLDRTKPKLIGRTSWLGYQLIEGTSWLRGQLILGDGHFGR